MSGSADLAGWSPTINCLLAYGGGHRDGDRHNHDDLPILLAGYGGAIRAAARPAAPIAACRRAVIVSTMVGEDVRRSAVRHRTLLLL